MTCKLRWVVTPKGFSLVPANHTTGPLFATIDILRSLTNPLIVTTVRAKFEMPRNFEVGFWNGFIDLAFADVTNADKREEVQSAVLALESMTRDYIGQIFSCPISVEFDSADMPYDIDRKPT